MAVCTGAASLTTADSSGAGTSCGRAAPLHIRVFSQLDNLIWSNPTDLISFLHESLVRTEKEKPTHSIRFPRVPYSLLLG